MSSSRVQSSSRVRKNRSQRRRDRFQELSSSLAHLSSRERDRRLNDLERAEWFDRVNREMWKLAARYLLLQLRRKARRQRFRGRLLQPAPRSSARSRLRSNPRDRRDGILNQ